MLPRLQEIEIDILSRRTRPEANGWLGEIEGIDLTLAFLRDKRAQAERTSARGTVALGMPAPISQH
ncbi:recombinase [Plantactinospora endophytica]|nr:recombinase [Plantactinospora endophytica]